MNGILISLAKKRLIGFNTDQWAIPTYLKLPLCNLSGGILKT